MRPPIPLTDAKPIAYAPLADANPRAGSVTLVDFAGSDDWTKTKPFRIALADGSGRARPGMPRAAC